MRRRHKARRWALQILYAWEARERTQDLRDTARDFFDRRRVAPETRAFAERLIDAVAANSDEIDSILATGTENWEFGRLSIIDRNILRIALAEFLHLEDVPFRVSIDEAITLAGRYGGADSPRFVNGVLDALAHRLDLIPS
ncbi:MAG TPA: transcription antitermination factor NusB [Gemmatimonadota bacterium]|nr:transcription antitermination factor NusB [Gemmatimonadota bacterium]